MNVKCSFLLISGCKLTTNIKFHSKLQILHVNAAFLLRDPDWSAEGALRPARDRALAADGSKVEEVVSM